MNIELETFLKKQKSSYTQCSYKWCLCRLVEWAKNRDIEMESIDAEKLTCFLDDQVAWRGNTRRLAICAARAYYRWWKGADHAILKIKLLRVKADPQRVLSVMEAIRFLASIDTDTAIGKRDLAMIALMLDTGLREAEVCRLEMNRLRIEDRKLQVIVKGGDWGKAVFSAVTAEHLTDWIEARKTIHKEPFFRTRLTSHGLPAQVFVSAQTGQAITTWGLREIFRTLSIRSGITVSPHDLRRTFATIATKAGAPTRILMAAGRWHNLAQLESYTAGIEPEDFEPWFPISFLANGGRRLRLDEDDEALTLPR